ncbi:MAG: NADP-dependent oxidoreductase [Ilumatobacter sp.]|uniref:quinone oxidoreductase family protein n=1 Tax=Ilumatobacter sp. TaxID=1967498 RepID=UPI003297BAC4
MRAVGVITYGGPEALEVVELPEPVAGPGEILLRVHAAAVNPTDTYGRNGARAEQQRKSPPPYVSGMDVAGVVEAIGPDTDTSLGVGDRAMAIVVPNGSHGGYSERLALPAGSVVAVPAGATDVEASTLPMNALTARLALDLLGLAPGQTLAVTGAAGAFGGYAVQLAKVDGLRVIADASEADEALVYELGADVVVRRGDDVADRIREHAPDGVDGIVDGAVQNELVFDALCDGGGFATVRGYDADAPRDIEIHPVWVREYAEEREKLDLLRQQVEEGVLTLRVADTFAPDDAPEAHRRLETGGVRGRLVIEF